MPVHSELLKSDFIEQLQHLAQQRLDAPAAARASLFFRGVFEHAPPADIVRERPEYLYAATLSLLELAERRSPGQPTLRIYNPPASDNQRRPPLTVIEIVTDDMPFLVDSVSAELSRLEIEQELFLHPMFLVNRDEHGQLTALQPNAESEELARESFMQVRVSYVPEQGHAELSANLLQVLTDVRMAVEDFAKMRTVTERLTRSIAECHLPVPEDDKREIVEFLEWLNRDHFTYLGYRRCVYTPDSESSKAEFYDGMGILRDVTREVFEDLQPPHRYELLGIFKANRRSRVHRPVHLDAIVISDPTEPGTDGPVSTRGGQARTVHLFIGLFTLSAYSRSPRFIPLLRQKVQRALLQSGLPLSSHDGKALRYVLETYPRDELFQISVEDLLRISRGIVNLQNRQRVALFVRKDPFERFVSCLVYLPRDRFDTPTRLRVQELIAQAFHGSVRAQNTQLDDQALARLHLIVKTPSGIVDVPHVSLESKLWEATRSWQDRLSAALINELGEERGQTLARTYRSAFPVSYQERYNAEAATADIESIERTLQRGELSLQLLRPTSAAPAALGLKVFYPGGFLMLSDALPTLERMGLRVESEISYEVHPAGAAQPLWVHDFALCTEDGSDANLGPIEDHFIDVLSGSLLGRLENDGFNRLVLFAGLGAREVMLLRAYAKFLRQCGVPFSVEYMQQCLKRNANLARLLVELFAAKLLPRTGTSPGTSERLSGDAEQAREIHARILTALDAVTNLDEDRILRRFLNAIECTLRTNLYQAGKDGPKDYLAVKFDSQRLLDIPAPRPYREIFVFGPRVEGVHLRFGAVARGGIRWSDRLEDFRTEVLGLVKAQQVKNAVIVPVGSKGGFVVKRPPGVPAPQGRDALLNEGIECYRTFIRGLLDLTDNRQGDQVTPPPQVVCLDEPDPYLVVAADKGTATFSDIANSLSQSNGFWLDDAFASGGSAGYDHKKMGITARGAWESVKRHFRELGKDVQKSPFSCIGVGDMSGDVFGNGMLLSRQTQLVAAFNHQHIFIDPNPDPAAAFDERQRLFNLPRSAWSDYTPALISAGGGVYERSAKAITLSPLAKQRLGLDHLTSATFTPSELIRHLLCAPVELLFFGGIGTYIKAEDESNSDVGDRTNDGLRVNAKSLRAKAIGEGANLGLTQRARVEFALAGGRCNTDFIDNSAGVDCSDHEVNIKILLTQAEQQGSLTREQRDVLLREMTEDVAALVLRDNYLQTQALSVTEYIGLRYTDRVARSMRDLERSGRLDRKLEALPDPDTLADRARDNLGFCRPELCLLLSHSKNALYSELLASHLPDEPRLESELVSYFPAALSRQFLAQISTHRLRREIIATSVTNDLINRVGVTFCSELGERTGMPWSSVALAYVAAREIHGAEQLWAAVEALDNQVPAATQYGLLMEIARALVTTTTWLLYAYGLRLNLDNAINNYGPGFTRLVSELDRLLPEEELAAVRQRTDALVAAGVPMELASRVARLPLLSAACDIISVSRDLHRDVDGVARLYFAVGQRFGFGWLGRLARSLPVQRAWDKQAVAAATDDLLLVQRELVREVLRGCTFADELDVNSVLAEFAAPRQALITRSQQMLSELQAMTTVDFAMLTVASRQLKALLGGISP